MLKRHFIPYACHCNISWRFLGSLLDISRYLSITLAARNNGRLRNDGCYREQHGLSETLQLTGKGVNYEAPPSTRHIERMGRGGLATGRTKDRKKLGGRGGKANVTLIASGASWLSTRQSLPGNEPQDLWQLGAWTPERVIKKLVLFANMSGPGQDSEPEAKVLLIKRLYRWVDATVLCHYNKVLIWTMLC